MQYPEMPAEPRRPEMPAAPHPPEVPVAPPDQQLAATPDERPVGFYGFPPYDAPSGGSLKGPALVTGATGFVGCHVARLLAAQGQAIRVLARPGSRRDNLAGLPRGRAEIVEGDLTSPAS